MRRTAFVLTSVATLLNAGCGADDAPTTTTTTTTTATTTTTTSEPDYCVPASDAGAGPAWSPPGLAALVDPLIGTAGSGNAVPGPLVPHGMVKLSPDTDRDPGSVDGYDYDDARIQGFSHTHLEGPGGSNYGYKEVLLLPQTGALNLNPTKNPSAFSHATEIALPGYYAVTLDDYGVRAELTATAHAGLHRYSFEKCGGNRVIIASGNTGGQSADGAVAIVGDDTVEGSATSKVWPLLSITLASVAPDTGLSTVYFSIRFNRRFHAFGTSSSYDPTPDSRSGSGPSAGAWVEFDERAGRTIEARVGISFVSLEQAQKNRDTEVGGKTFEEVREATAGEWAAHLSRIEVEGGTEEERKMFYTALYHSLMQPADYTEDGRAFVGGGGGVVVDTPDHHYYADDWCAWDTARATHPLLTLLDPEVKGDMMQSYVTWYEQAGWIGKCSWHAAGDSRAMTANFPFCSIADAFTKGLDGFDVATAYEAMRKGSMEDSPNPGEVGLCGYFNQGTPPDYVNLGWVSKECDSTQGASMTLEHAYNDWCVARVAEGLGKTDDQTFFEARSGNWKNVWNPAHGFFQQRRRDGTFVEPFDPLSSNTGFTESGAWQYLFAVPHDLCGLVDTMGGANAFEARLDELFDGGHFDPTNEPDFHAPYLYGVVGAPAKSAARVRDLVKTAFSATPSGLPGNDDAGATSAWLAFALLGFYPITPGDGTFWLASPHFDRVTIHVDRSQAIDFVIEAQSNGAGAPFIQSAALDGAPVDVPRLAYADIAKGGKLSLVMGATPSAWGVVPVCP